jgi:glutamate synthase (NADPH/NADH) small chain
MSREFVLNEKGEVRAVRAVRSEPVKDPVSGRFVPKAIEGSEFEIECDLVFLAMGFAHPNQKVLESFKLSADKRGNILAQTEGDAPFATSAAKVFATGDCRKGQSLVVHALSEGRRCAEAVDLYLKG